ncbi:hypothetical protein [Nocardia sp. NPDC052316]|uniref:hypothetical protein n=1 Tax=Nocardia sp. NPDC052316 TaxID=3364329 RepID=UPI0037CA2D9F
MTRDLPFDDDATEAAERAGDTAYRVATGVARVARAGAYVTGGALVAANGGGVPAHPGSSHADSKNAGWAHNSDPDADLPSPTITFPDPVVEPAPLNSPYAANSPVAHGNSGFGLPGTHPGGAHLPTFGDEYNGTDAGFALPGTEAANQGMGLPSLPGGASNQHGVQLPGTPAASDQHGVGLPGTAPGTGMGLPGTPGGIGLPGTDAGPAHRPGAEVEAPGGNGFGLPGHGLGQAGHGFGLPGANGFVAPGSGVFDLPGSQAAPAAGGPFDGVGDAGGDPLGIFVGTQWSVDFAIGPQGIYFNSEMKVDLGAGHVGDQLDQFTDWLGSGLHVPDGNDRAVTDSAMPGHGNPGVVGGLTTPGSSSTQSTHSTHSAAPTPTTQPVIQAMPAPAPMTQAAVAPVATAAAAPAVVAPVASAAPQPVAATPLQTTIQPDAATTPIANVFGAPEGPSVLTVPAAATPALFEQARSTPVVKPTPIPDSKPTDVSVTTPNMPTTITKTVPVPTVPSDITTPSIPKTPDLTTKVPGAGHPSTPHGGISTGPDVPTTKTPPATGTQPTQSPTIPDDDVTTPSTGAGSGGVTTQPTVPTREVPTVTQPDPTVPTRDVPTAVPTHNAPVPTHDLPPTFTAPTQAPVPTYKPPIVDPKPHAIADNTHMVGASTASIQDYPTYTDHSTLASGGLSGGLLPESSMADTHHMGPGGLDTVLI